ncbi:MAG: hypothetical protein CMQ29_09785 [Gammaproteobacteria bacterium]|nr:hypothetical protein [Gammaproteobacteria bacterium]
MGLRRLLLKWTMPYWAAKFMAHLSALAARDGKGSAAHSDVKVRCFHAERMDLYLNVVVLLTHVCTD